ncbi:unnamed protein product [Linum trigynum]|uniref:RNase H type-1 domain-containing protein n=1 Tax=Linum trigynum TaxID=586398 RepID=A0AAV2GWT5_9ROSI
MLMWTGYTRLLTTRLLTGSAPYSDISLIDTSTGRICRTDGQGLPIALVIQTDSAAAISLIQADPSSHPHRIRMLLASIRRFLALDWEITMGHVFREGNVVVDYLAFRGH